MVDRKRKQEVIPPKGGWKKNTYYVVEVASSSGNPIHAAIMSVGFLDDKTKEPTSYCYVFNMSYKPEALPMSHFIYIKAIREIDMSIEKKGITPSQKRALSEISDSFKKRAEKEK